MSARRRLVSVANRRVRGHFAGARDLPGTRLRTAITSVVELRAAAVSVKRGESVVLRIERLGRFRYLTFEME
jgi:hypothetical protein